MVHQLALGPIQVGAFLRDASTGSPGPWFIVAVRIVSNDAVARGVERYLGATLFEPDETSLVLAESLRCRWSTA